MNHFKGAIFSFTSVISLFSFSLLSTPLQAQTGESLQWEYTRGKVYLRNESMGLNMKLDNKVYFDLTSAWSMDKLHSPSSSNSSPSFPVYAVNIPMFYLAMRGNITDKWVASVEVDVAGRDVKVRDTYLGYNFPHDIQLRFGNMRVPGGMGQNISYSTLSFHDRPLTAALQSPRRMGVGAFSFHDDWSAALGAYTLSADGAFIGRLSHPEILLAGRGTYKVMKNSSGELMLGLNMQYLLNSLSGSDLTLDPTRLAWKSALDDLPLKLSAVHRNFNVGTELAWTLNRWLLTGEWVGTFYGNALAPKSEDVTSVMAWYLGASYMFRGPSRSYSRSTAAYTERADDSGKGWELAGRVGGMALNPQGTTNLGINTFTLYTNVWFNHHIAFGAGTSYTMMDGDLLTYTSPGGIFSLYGRALLNF